MAPVLVDVRQKLALEGGDPIVPKGYLMHARWPRVSEEDITSLVHMLRSGELTEMSGRDRMHVFETDMAMWLGTRYALTTNSGTAALHCALAGLGVGPGDEVIVPTLSYIACPAAVVHQHAIPILVDVDPLTYNLTRATVEPHITPRTKCIMAVHLHGLPVDLDSILELATERGIPVLEDFSQAVGAAYRGRKVGSWGKVGAASLMAGKNLPSAGEAGILVTNERLVRNMAATLKCFGEAINEKGAYQPLHETYGYNYRANLLALGFASTQLFRIDAFTEERRRNAARLSAVLDKIPGFTTPCDSEKAEHVYHMYRFRFEPEKAGLEITADQAREGLKQIFLSEGLPLVEFQNQPLSDHALMKGSSSYGSGWPWHREPSFQRDAGPESFPGALDAIRHSLVVGFPAKAPMANSEVVDHYIACFQKLSQNMRSFERIAARLEAHPPWHQEARLF